MRNLAEVPHPPGVGDASARIVEGRRLPDASKSGIEGYQMAMARLKQLTQQETLVAITALHQGKSLTDLKSHQSFQQTLEQENAVLVTQRAQNKTTTPENSLTELFAESRTIEQFIAFGNFEVIGEVGYQFVKSYSYLTLPIEEYFQRMLLDEMPKIIQAYKSDHAPFRSFAYTRLKHRAIDMVRSRKVEISVSRYDGTHESDQLISLEQEFRNRNDEEEAGDVEDPTANNFETTVKAQEYKERLLRRAGLDETQQETLEALASGEKPREIAARTDVSVTIIYRILNDIRQKFRRNVPYETAVQILQGE